MQISLNEREVDVPCRDGATLDSLLDALRSEGQIAPDEVVVGIEVDSRRLNAEDLEERAAMPLSGAEGVVIATDGLRGYASRMLTDALGMVNVLREAAPRVADGLRESSEARANADLFTLLDALQQLLICLYQVQNTCTLQTGPANAADARLQRVDEVLTVVQQRQEQRDWEGLAEQLDGALLGDLDDLASLIGDMRDEL